jgi:hypothetical protein
MTPSHHYKIEVTGIKSGILHNRRYYEHPKAGERYDRLVRHVARYFWIFKVEKKVEEID